MSRTFHSTRRIPTAPPNTTPHGKGAKVCEAQERNTRAIYQLRGMAQQWVVDIPLIIQILTGECQHEDPQGSSTS